MSAGARPRPGLVRAAAGALLDFMIEPVGEAEPPVVAPAAALRAQPVVAVIGLAPRCGTTVVARGLAAELARRAPDGIAAVTATTAAGVGLGAPAAGRLARSIAARSGAQARAAGRLCLFEAGDPDAAAAAVAGQAPLAIDVGDPARGLAAATLADGVVLVASPATEPALAAVLAGSLRGVGCDALLVLTRARDVARWEGRDALRLPESRMAAQAALAGRLPRGQAGRAFSELADLITAV